MYTEGTLGGLIPMWILGAPFLLAFIELMKAPKPTPRSVRSGSSAGSSPSMAPAGGSRAPQRG